MAVAAQTYDIALDWAMMIANEETSVWMRQPLSNG